ncbi:MAG: FtsW/RodA/SpoVE family cell cycle protein [Bacteroidia bacterium]|nr:FtsW/RodA/SpoVE family cell cycle protein [Bacteroidia bacterium]
MLRAGHGIALLALTLLLIGVVFVNSAEVTVARDTRTTLSAVLFDRHTIFAIASMGCLLLGMVLPVERIAGWSGWRSPLVWATGLSLMGLLAVHVPGLGKEVNGASRWVSLGPLTFQPSELAKWLMPIGLAWYIARTGERMQRFVPGFLLPMAIVGVVALGIAGEDLGTAVLVTGVAVIMLLAGGANLWNAVAFLPVGAAGFIALVFISPYRLKRIFSVLDPYSDPQGSCYHIIQSMGAISGGGVAGRGLGNSVQKFGYLPEGTTDFIYSIICEEMGLLGAVAVLLLYVGLVWCIVQVVSSRVPAPSTDSPFRDPGQGVPTPTSPGSLQPALDPMSRVLALGIGATVGLQAVINVVVVTGMAPTKGIALPLISRGGTGWMMTALCLGMVIAMDRRVARAEAQTDDPGAAHDASSPAPSPLEVAASGGMPEPAEP